MSPVAFSRDCEMQCGEMPAAAAIWFAIASGMKLAIAHSMMDRSREGRRCHTKRPIVHHVGLIPRATAGTVRYETENIGRRLMRIDLDTGHGVMLLVDDVIVEACVDG